MKKYIMLPVLMVSFLLTQNPAQASNSAEKYLHSNYSASSKSKKSKVSKKKAKPSAKHQNKPGPIVAKVGKKYGGGHSIASAGSGYGHNKKSAAAKSKVKSKSKKKSKSKRNY